MFCLTYFAPAHSANLTQCENYSECPPHPQQDPADSYSPSKRFGRPTPSIMLLITCGVISIHGGPELYVALLIVKAINPFIKEDNLDGPAELTA